MPAATSAWRVRLAVPDDAERTTTFLEEHDAELVARLGRLEDARRAPRLPVEEAGAIVGMLTYLIDDDACEGPYAPCGKAPAGAAQEHMLENPVVAVGFARGDLRLFRVSLMRGGTAERDHTH